MSSIHGGRGCSNYSLGGSSSGGGKSDPFFSAEKINDLISECETAEASVEHIRLLNNGKLTPVQQDLVENLFIQKQMDRLSTYSGCTTDESRSFNKDDIFVVNKGEDIALHVIQADILDCSDIESAYTQISFLYNEGSDLDGRQKTIVSDCFLENQQKIWNSAMASSFSSESLDSEGGGYSSFGSECSSDRSTPPVGEVSIDVLTKVPPDSEDKKLRKREIYQDFSYHFGITDAAIVIELTQYISEMANMGLLASSDDSLEEKIAGIVQKGLHENFNYYSYQSGLYDFLQPGPMARTIAPGEERKFCQLSLIGQLTTFFKEKMTEYEPSVHIADAVGGHIEGYDGYFVARASENHFEVKKRNVDGKMLTISVPDDGMCLFSSALIVQQMNAGLV